MTQSPDFIRRRTLRRLDFFRVAHQTEMQKLVLARDTRRQDHFSIAYFKLCEIDMVGLTIYFSHIRLVPGDISATLDAILKTVNSLTPKYDANPLDPIKAEIECGSARYVAVRGIAPELEAWAKQLQHQIIPLGNP